jgi:hypothetical protein
MRIPNVHAPVIVHALLFLFGAPLLQTCASPVHIFAFGSIPFLADAAIC